MASMKALRSFTDSSTGRLVMEGSMFECDDENARLLASTGAAVAVPSEQKPKHATARQRRAKSK